MNHLLSTYHGLAGLEVVRDGRFAVTGKLSTPLDGLCVPLRSAKYADEVNANPRVTAVITRPEIVDALDARLAVAVADQPDAAHSEVHGKLAVLYAAWLRDQPNKIDPAAMIDPAAQIADHGVQIGARTWIGANVSVAPGVVIENDCVLHAGVALGVPGFNVGIIGGRQRIMPQMGGVRLKPWVELLANVCVARAVFGGETMLGEETVADNLVYIAHDVQIGRRVQLCALVNILGRTVIGNDAYLGPSAVIKNGLIVGDRARVSIGAVVTQDVAPDTVVTGNFAVLHDRFLDHIRSIR
jgi:UDP-3-O-[3-hydroxymyristoyl] glucosamine N-acyltransferase